MLYRLTCDIQQMNCMLHLSYNTFGFYFNCNFSQKKKKNEKRTLGSKKYSVHQKKPKKLHSCLVFHSLSEPLSGDVTSASVLFHIEGKLTAATQAPSDVSRRSQSHFPALVAVSVIMMISGDRCTANEQKQRQAAHK